MAIEKKKVEIDDLKRIAARSRSIKDNGSRSIQNKRSINKRPEIKKPEIKKQEIKKEEIKREEPVKTIVKPVGKKKNIIGLVVIIVLSIMAMALLVTVMVLYGFSLKLRSAVEDNNLTFSKDIDSVFLDKDVNSLYIRVLDSNRSSNLTYAKVKFLLKNKNGTIYTINSNKTIDEIILSQVSIPENKNIFSMFTNKDKEINYNYKIDLSDINGLDRIDSITYVELVFVPLIAAPVTTINRTNTNTTRNTTRTPAPNTPSNPTTPTNPTNNCTNTAWLNQSFKCTNGIREVKQSRTLCASGNIEERYVENLCLSGYRCYDGPGSSSDKCINATINCTDSDNGINSSLFGVVNISNILYNDVCILSSKNLTEFSCLYNGSEFIPKNDTITCSFLCNDGACLTCTDADVDGYSPDEGACGIKDCNDTVGSIHPGATEICGNSIDEDCSGSDMDCVALDSGLLAHYRFNDSIADGIATDETGVNDATCGEGNCPKYNETVGLNGSASYDFNSSSYFLIIPPGVLNNRSYSISMWIRPMNIENQVQTLIYSDSGDINNANLIFQYTPILKKIMISNQYLLDISTQSNTINLSQWTNVVFNYDTTTRKAELFINNVTKGASTSFMNSLEPTRIYLGNSYQNSNINFQGYIDELRVYNRTLTKEEINALYTDYSSNQLMSTPSLGFFDRIIDFFKRLF